MSIRHKTHETAVSAAKLYFEQNADIRAIGIRLQKSQQTIRRLLAMGKQDGWWTLQVATQDDAQGLLSYNEELADQLCRRTHLYNAQVVKTFAVEAAYTDGYLSSKDQERRAAYLAGDLLHEKLGLAAARYVVDSLMHEFAIGVASGRGVMYTILALERFLREDARTAKLQGLRVLSLCGGMKVSPWEKQLRTDLDADTAAYQLTNVLGIGRDRVGYVTGPVSDDDPVRYLRNLEGQLSATQRIDIALLGLGVLDSGHHFFRFQGPQLEPISEYLNELRRRLVQGRPSHQIAEIAHRLFWVGEGSVPADFRRILDEFNSKIVGASPDTLKRAREVVLVAGGRQKLLALRRLCFGEAEEVPIHLGASTLITDEWTAKGILARSARS